MLFWSLLFTFAAWIGWSCFHFSFDRERLYQPIPDNAMFVSEHLDLARRWDEIGRDVLTASLTQFIGVQDRRADRVLQDPQLAWMIRNMARRDSVIAYVPNLGFSGAPAWVFSTWVGTRGILLRAELSNGLIKGFQNDRLEGGRRAWRLAQPLTRDGWRLSLAVAEGVMVGCIGPDPRGIQVLIDRIERKTALLPELRMWFKQVETSGQDEIGTDFRTANDRGWLCWYARKEDSLAVRWVRFALKPGDQLGAEIHARAKLGFVLPAEAAATQNRGTAADRAMLDLLRDAPALAFGLSAGAAHAWTLQAPLPRGARMAVDLVREDAITNAPLVVALCTTNYSGRLMGLRVPTLLVVTPLNHVTNLQAWVSEKLDRINAKCGTSLIAAAPADGAAALVLDDVGPGLLGKLQAGEKPAIALRDGWLVFASNAEALERLRTPEVPGRPADSLLLSSVLEGTKHGAVFKASMPAAHDSLVKALAVYDLMNYGQGDRPPWRTTMDGIVAWLAAAAPLQTVTVELKTVQNELEAVIRLGPSSGHAP